MQHQKSAWGQVSLNRAEHEADLKQQIVDGSLHLQSEAVAGIVLAEGELVIDAKDRNSRDSCAGLGRLLVLLTALQDFDLQLLQLCPARDRYEKLQIRCVLIVNHYIAGQIH